MKGETTKLREVEVLPCNWWAVQTALRCQQTMLAGGMGGAVLLGFSAAEIRSAAEMLRVPVDEWPDAIDGAQMIGGIVARIENERARKRQASAR